MSFIGYFLFSIFGGIGLAALPIDLIRSYGMRPVYVLKITKIELFYKLFLIIN